MTDLDRISPLLRLLADALDARTPSATSGSATLIELGRLARLHIPANGVLPLADDKLFDAIDKSAIKHLDLGAMRQALDVALARIDPLATRDELEVAVDQLCAVLNVAYFNAGLAFGVTFADLRSL